ncbi:hypothetical protein BDV38DRAFT_277723 [Aspergillus pseudotamarii]|uniref:Acyclic terpene utilisation N-terminal domain-containing protein n=1 Tax=Aspergillus pseudotamarii TaxID=132259 RepID=A0A5N6T9F2_ASPPS|nr:uncharacterized protein BDV38DRAFT_277723 [Aspergillus pseudotamarii]KAE8142910.1 hypothetical protein BDV38DRAFT_277723 [Aspergillus pseudotamarii]
MVAWADGDNVIAEFQVTQKAGAAEQFPHLEIDGQDPSAVENRECRSPNTVDICGRCCDASPVIDLASWWHGWSDMDYDQLAGSVIAGHLTECGPYTTEGKYCGFKSIPSLVRVGYPKAEVYDDSSSVITIHPGSNRAVTVDTVKAQLVYEMQGPKYLNLDVVAHLDDIRIKEDATYRVLFGGYQAEMCTFAVELHIKEKVELQRKQILNCLDQSRFSTIAIDAYRSVPKHPKSQKKTTVRIGHFVQEPSKEAIGHLTGVIMFCNMQGYGGFRPNMSLCTLAPKPYIRYFPVRFQQSALKVQAHVEGQPPNEVEPVPKHALFAGQSSHETTDPADLQSLGPTRRAPLGSIILAQPGDMGGTASVALWKLLGDGYQPEYHVKCFALPHLHAVDFVTYGILQEGVSNSSIIDGFAKWFGEFVRVR